MAAAIDAAAAATAAAAVLYQHREKSKDRKPQMAQEEAKRASE